jgi:hypothetical protein
MAPEFCFSCVEGFFRAHAHEAIDVSGEASRIESSLRLHELEVCVSGRLFTGSLRHRGQPACSLKVFSRFNILCTLYARFARVSGVSYKEGSTFREGES